MLKRFFTIFSAIACLNAFADLPTPDKTTEQLDAVVAVINKEIITQNEFDQALKFTKQQIQQSGADMPDEKTLRKKVLDSLIDRDLQLQLAKQNKITVSDKQIDQQILDIAKHNNTDLVGLKSQLAANNLPYETFRKQIHDQMLIQQIQQGVVAGSISVTSQDIKQFRTEHANDVKNTQYNVADILIPIANLNNKAAVNAAHTRALELMQAIDSGTDKSTAVKKYNATYTEMGMRNLNDFPSLFTKPIATTQKGGLAGPILAPNGYHLLIILDKQGAANQMTDDQIRELLSQQQAADKIKAWLVDIHKTAYIKINPEYE